MTHRITHVLELGGLEHALADVVSQVAQKETRIIVEDQGVPVAAIISADELRRLSHLDREREDQFSVIDRVRTAFASIPDAEIEKETDKIIEGIRTNNPTTMFDE